jgi:hypothetical protein
MAASLTLEDARGLLRDGTPLNGNAFPVLGTIARLAIGDASVSDSRDLLIRVLDRREELSDGEQLLLDSLVLRLGLYPYATPDRLSPSEQIAFEYHRPESLEDEDFVFHTLQLAVYERLLEGESLFLSAPTSFGKSVITDALVASGKWDRIAIVVPTLALIDETRRRLARFSNLYKINTFPSQAVRERTLFIMTQERLLEVDPFPEVQLFMIDEFYKLDSETDVERAALLNIAWDRLRRTGAQYYLTGPNITGLSERLPDELRESLIVTDFRTVAVDQVDVPVEANERSRVLAVCRELAGPTLIYCRTPARVREVARWLLDGGVGTSSAQGSVAGSWVAENYDPEWTVSKCLSAGIGLHHARVPRALQHHTVRLFNSGALKYLVCTSTLIEGVNTAAENVLVVDHILNRQRLDYFTFSNIRGRAGRMFRHFVGRVFLFSKSPEPVQTTIDIPISSQSARATPAALLQLPEDELSDDARARLAPYLEQDVLDVDILRANRGVDPGRQVAVARAIRAEPTTWNRRLAWSGRPDFDQAVAVSRLMLDHLVPSQQKGRVTDRSLAARLNAVRRARGSVPELVEGQLRYSESRDEAVEDVLFFNRNWLGHTFPRALMAIDRIQREVFEELGLPLGNYAFYANEVENLFIAPFVVTLEEYGLPVPVSLKLERLGLRGDSLDEMLSRLRIVAANPRVTDLLDPFEQEMLDEVVAGLGPQG